MASLWKDSYKERFLRQFNEYLDRKINKFFSMDSSKYMSVDFTTQPRLDRRNI